MKKKRILLVGSDLTTVRGGMVSMIRNLLEYEDWEEFELSYLVTHTEGSKGKILRCFFKGYIKLFFLLLGKRVSLLHLQVSERGSVYRKAAVLFMAKRMGCPVIVHHHGAEFWSFYRELSERKKAFVRKFVEAADQNILLSENVCKDFLKEFPKARTAVVGNAVKVPEKNLYTGGGDAVITLGKLGERKGTYILLKAFSEKEKELPENIRLWLCGDGETEKTKETADRLGLQRKIDHIGWISGKEKEKAISQAVVHILPSYKEVLPMSILETMARGIPNISTEIASIPELVEHGVNGYLTEPGDWKTLAEYIEKICWNRELRMEMSQKAYETVRDRFSIPICCERFKKIYRELLNCGGKP